MTASICLNADLGELPGPEGRTIDALMLAVLTRCNIACGGHAGDVESMQETVRAAKRHGVRIGAHPSYPDKANFGRLSVDMTRDALGASLRDQVAQLRRIAAAEDARVHHVKPHGALYNEAAKDADLARCIAEVTRAEGIGELIGPPDSELEVAAVRAGLRYLPEGFADRSYEPDGALTPRSVPGAVIVAVHEIASRAVTLVKEHRVPIRGGGVRPLRVSTLCLHSDTPGAAGNAGALRCALEAAGIGIAP